MRLGRVCALSPMCSVHINDFDNLNLNRTKTIRQVRYVALFERIKGQPSSVNSSVSVRLEL